MPEQIRLKVGQSPQNGAKSSVYEDFAKNIPGFKQLNVQEVSAITPKVTAASAAASAAAAAVAQAAAAAAAAAQNTQQQQPLSADQPSLAAATAAPPAPGPAIVGPLSDECITWLSKVLQQVEPFVMTCTTLPEQPHMVNLKLLVEALLVTRTTKDGESLLRLIKKVVENIMEGLTSQLSAQVDSESLAKYRDANLLVLKALVDPSLQFGTAWLAARVTHALIEAREDIK